jgi:hypothetical protein
LIILINLSRVNLLIFNFINNKKANKIKEIYDAIKYRCPNGLVEINDTTTTKNTEETASNNTSRVCRSLNNCRLIKNTTARNINTPILPKSAKR